MDQASQREYATVLLDACLGVGPGDRLRIVGEPCHRRLMNAAAAVAYERGARAVRVDYLDPALSRIFIDGVREEWVEEVSALVGREAATFVEEGWAHLYFVGEEDPKALEGADSGRLQRSTRSKAVANSPLREAIRSNRVAWCIAPAPTAAWGRAVLEGAGREAGADPAAGLWAALAPILRLGGPDAAGAVRAHAAALAARAGILNSLGLDELRFAGPGTDFSVGLSPRSRWVGGGSTTPEGRFFIANHPTEEVFASPDARRAEGRVACTRPVEVLGAKVEGAWFEFRGGLVTGFGAARNEEALGRYLETDPGARRLGEVALVDATGPIFLSGLVFDNGLVDENAACHIALGSAYSEAFEGAGAMDETERAAAGFNESLVHIDFMIGSERVDVTGVGPGGRQIPLLRGGRFAV